MVDGLREQERKIEARQSRTPKKTPFFSGGGKFSGFRSGARKVLNYPISVKGGSLSQITPYTQKAKSGVEKIPGKIWQSISARDRQPKYKNLENQKVKGGAGVYDLGLSKVVAKTLPKVAKSIFPSKASVQSFLKSKVARKETLKPKEVQAVLLSDPKAFTTYADRITRDQAIVKASLKKQLAKPITKTKTKAKPKAPAKTQVQAKTVTTPKTKVFPKTKRKTMKPSYSRDTMEDLLNTPYNIPKTATTTRGATAPTALGLMIKQGLEKPEPGKKDTTITTKPKPQPKRIPETKPQPKITTDIPSVKPLITTKPATPTKPKAPTKPSTPTKPVTPTAPPEVPAPVIPKAPAKPTTPTKPKAPAKPITPTAPPKPIIPTQPIIPTAPAKAPAPAKASTPTPPPPSKGGTKTKTPPTTPTKPAPPSPKPGKVPTPPRTITKDKPPKKPTTPPPPPKRMKAGSGKSGKTEFENLKKSKITRFPQKVQWREGSQFVVYDLNKNIKRKFKTAQGIGVNPGSTPQESIKVIKEQRKRPKFMNVDVGGFKLSVASPTSVILRPLKIKKFSSIIATKRFRR